MNKQRPNNRRFLSVLGGSLLAEFVEDAKRGEWMPAGDLLARGSKRALAQLTHDATEAEEEQAPETERSPQSDVIDVEGKAVG